MKLFFLFAICFSIHEGFCENYELAKIAFNKNPVLTYNNTINENKQPCFFNELYSNFIEQSQIIVRPSQRDVLKIGIGLGITMGLVFLDRPIDNKIHSFYTKYEDMGSISSRVTELGGNYGLEFSALFAGFSYLTLNEKGIQTSRLLVQSLITSAVWTRVGKLLTGRERPFYYYEANKNYDNDLWSGPFTLLTKSGRAKPGSSWDSFPSGHTSTAFAIATVFAMQYKEQTAIPVIAYTLASIVGITRMTEHEHWASDVFVGACLGYFCAKQVCNNALKYNKEKRKLSFFANYQNNKIIAECLLTF